MATLKSIAHLILMLVLYSNMDALADEKNRLVLAASEDFAPFIYIDDKGEMKGIDYEIVRELYGRLGIEVNILLLPRLRISSLLSSGKIVDGIVSTTSYNDQKVLESLKGSSPLYTSSISIFSLRNANPFPSAETLTLNNGNDFINPPRVGMLRGFDYSAISPSIIRALKGNAIMVRADEQLVNLLFADRIAYAITEDISFAFQARKAGKFTDIRNDGQIFDRSVYTALSRKVVNEFPSLVERLNTEISVMIKEEYIVDVIFKYLNIQRKDSTRKDVWHERNQTMEK